MSSEHVASHYNSLPNAGVEARASSKIYYLRNFNNWMKSMLISEFLERLRREGTKDIRVLDLCCGKGGDLQKWKIGGISEIVMTDVAEVSLAQARERYTEVAERMRRDRRQPFKASFVVADASGVNLAERLKPTDLFDLTSCQFALHYSFEDEQKARQLVRNATERLRPGGYFIGTLPDAARIVNLIRAKGENNSYENEVCRIDLTDKELDLEKQRPALFGQQLYFALDKVVNCPEYLAYFPLLKELLDEQDMELVHEERFIDARKRYLEPDSRGRNEGRQLMQRMKAVEALSRRDQSHGDHANKEYAHGIQYLNDKFPDQPNEVIGTLSASEWEVISMYLVFAFRKRGGPPPPANGDAAKPNLKRSHAEPQATVSSEQPKSEGSEQPKSEGDAPTQQKRLRSDAAESTVTEASDEAAEAAANVEAMKEVEAAADAGDSGDAE